MIDKDQLYRFLDNIATLFGDRCEIVVHDFTTMDLMRPW